MSSKSDCFGTFNENSAYHRNGENGSIVRGKVPLLPLACLKTYNCLCTPTLAEISFEFGCSF